MNDSLKETICLVNRRKSFSSLLVGTEKVRPIETITDASSREGLRDETDDLCTLCRCTVAFELYKYTT